MSEVDVSELITVQRAIEIIDAVSVSPRRTMTVPLGDALGLRLAQEVKADRDYPPFDKALMDGFAIRVGDLTDAQSSLIVVGESAAGHPFSGRIESGQAAAIMTGAPVPDGADTVVPIEQIRGKNPIQVTAPVKKGQNIQVRGREGALGQLVLQSGVLLGPAQLAVAATVGASTLSVYARPRVAIFSTGDEVIPFDQSPSQSQIRNSNNIMLAGLLRQMNCEVTDLGIIPDNPDQIRAAVETAFAYDASFITGGMSMGQYDYVPRILKELGVDMKITKLKIKPGKPFVFGVKGTGDSGQGNGCFVFGLPGNPVSGFVCTVRLASRLMERLAGAKVVHENWTNLPLSKALPANGPREFYQPVRVEDRQVHPVNFKGSADVFTLAQANGLLVRSADEPARRPGEIANVLQW